MRRGLHGEVAFYNVNRHINPTNVCVFTYNCKFCSFAAMKGEPHAWEMTLEEVFARFCEDDVCALVGSLNAAAKAVRPLCKLSAALIYPSRRKGQDAQRWLEEGIAKSAEKIAHLRTGCETLG